jgi:death-on-curing protein
VILLLSSKQALRVHERQVEALGGTAGVRDQGALDSALARSQATCDGEEIRDLLAGPAS